MRTVRSGVFEKLAGLWLCAGWMATLLVAGTARTAADRVLGQPDFLHNAANTIDGVSMNTGDQLAVDTSVAPNRIYVADEGNSRVLGYSSVDALVSGMPADLVIGQPDFFTAGCNNGGISARSLCVPKGVAVDGAGNLYVGDASNNRVLVYNSPFDACSSLPCVSAGADLVFGQGENFTSGGCNNFGSRPTARTLCNPIGVAVDSASNVYIADNSNHRVLEFNTPLSTDTVADRVFGQAGSFTTNMCNLGGVTANSLCAPIGVAVDAGGNLFVAEFNNHRVLEYDTPLTTDTTADRVFGQGGSFSQNFCNFQGVTANTLCNPDGIKVDSAGNLFVSDYSNSRVLEYNTPLTTDTIADAVFGQAGSFTTQTCNLGGVSADSLCTPDGVGLDSSGRIYVVDRSNNRVLGYPSGSTTANLVLGQYDFVHRAPNSVDPSAFYNPYGVAIDATAKPNHLYIADFNNHRVLGYLDASTFVSGADADLVIGQPGFFSGDCNSGGVTAAVLCGPAAVAVDGAGNLYVSDSSNNRVLEYDNPFAACSSFPCVGGPASRVFGQGGSFTTGTCNLGGISADSLCSPQGLALDGAGNLYVADVNNSRVLEYNDPLNTDTTADLVFGQAGGFTTQTCNLGGISADSLCNPRGVAVDSKGNLYIADYNNSRILEYDTPLASDTTADRVFGQGGGFLTNSCNNGGVGAASLCFPQGITVDGSDSLYVGDVNNHRVLRYNTPRTSATADRVFGQNGNFTSGNCNLGGSRPTAETLCQPASVATDTLGNLLIGDYGNNRVLEYDTP
jgi:sugar lactone lactonase YvrE